MKKCLAPHPDHPGVKCGINKAIEHKICKAEVLQRRASKNHNTIRAYYSWENQT